jgi:hypothetical protein
MRSYLRAFAWSLGFLIFCLSSSLQAFAATYTLTVQIQGSGTVSRNPTNSVYPEGAVVTITATPGAGWYFAGWLDDASGVMNPLSVTMNSNKVITAYFYAIPNFTLSIETSGQGTVSLDPPGGTYLRNTDVLVTAIPATGWVFVQWRDGASGSVNPLSVNVYANKSITAVFAELPAIDSQPQNVNADIGDTVSFSVHAIGTPPLAYQWFANGSPLAGATAAALTVTNVQTTQEGEYWAVVTNPYGSAASSRATLAVRGSCAGTNVVSTCTEASLRTAIAAGGVVTLCCNGTITLTNTIEIARDVALDARGRNVTLSGGNAVRLFNVAPGVRFSLTNVVLANGRHVGRDGTNGVGQPPFGSLSESGFPGWGGAIFNNGGIVEMVSSTLMNNRAVGGRGGRGEVGGSGSGGAIFSINGSLLLQSVTMSNNIASGGAGGSEFASIRGGDGLGGAVYTTNSAVLLVNSVLKSNACTTVAGGSAENSSAARGGALFLASGSLSISNSYLEANQAAGGDAPLILGSFPRPGSAYGGAIAASGGTVRMDHSQLASNTARGGQAFRHSGTGEAQGGAVFSGTTLLAFDCGFAGNQAVSGSFSSSNTDGRGGALHNNGIATLNGCSFYVNSAIGGAAGAFGSPSVNYPGGHGLGGGIFNSGQLAATNCTMVLNSATGGAGGFPSGIPGSGVGGGIHNDTNGSLTAMNLTVASNFVAAGMGWLYSGTAAGANVANQTNGALALRNSLIAYGGTNGNAWGVVIDGGFNISSDGTANLNSGSSFNLTDPHLGPLANYGGPTLTMALRPNSPAIDFGGADGAPSIDQRGFSRPFGAGIDIGAYEFHSNQTELPRLSISSVPNGVVLTFEASAGTAYHLQACETLSPPWGDLETIGPFANTTPVTRTISSTGISLRYFRLEIP